MELNTRFITTDDFKAYFGIDLEKSFKGSDNQSMASKGFIERETNRLEAYISARLDKNMEWLYPYMSDFQKRHYKLALLEQCYYVFINGEISTDSGFDKERGPLATNGQLSAKSIAPNTINELLTCGIWNANIRGRIGWWDVYGY